MWRPASKEDRGAVQNFVCTDPPRPYKSPATGYKPHHPRMWEYEAQKMIRDLSPDLPCVNGPVRAYVAEDNEGIAAVVSWTELDGPGYVHVDILGVAMRHRRKKSDFAQSIVRTALKEIESAAIEAQVELLYVEGEIYRLNDASQALAASMKFSPQGDEAPTGAQTWGARWLVGGAEIEEPVSEEG